MVRIIILLTILTIYTSLTTLAQNQVFQRIEAPAEINSLEIFCTYQDSNGLMWLGTSNGIYSYDGYIFRHYDNPIEGDFSITTIQEVNNQLWLGAWRDSGLWLFDRSTSKFTNAKDMPGFAPFFGGLFCVRNIHLEGNIVWMIATLSQRRTSVLARYNLLTREVNYYFFNNPAHIDRLDFNSFTKTRENGRELIWIATHTNGMYEFDPATKKFTIHLPKPGQSGALTHRHIRHIYASPTEPVLWISTLQGLDKFDLQSRKVIRRYAYRAGHKQSLTNSHIWTVLEINRKLWVATDNGLNCIDLVTDAVTQYKHFPKDPETISGNTVRGLYYNQGMLWITTFSDGINQLDMQPGNFTHYPFVPEQPGGFTGNSIIALGPGRDNAKTGMWVGTETGLFFFDPRIRHLSKHNRDDENPTAFFSIATQDNRLWLKTDQGFGKYEVAKRRFYTDLFSPGVNDSLNKNVTWFAHSFKDDSVSLWMGSWEQGITYLNTKTGKIRTYRPTMVGAPPDASLKQASFPVVVAHRGKKYVYFISTVPYISATLKIVRHCLVRLDPEKSEYTYYTQDAKNPYSLAANYLTSLHSSGDSVLWIGTHKSGLEKFDVATGRFTHLGEKEGIKSTTVFNAITDLHGNVWMSTNTGISRMDIRTGRVTNYRGAFMEGQYWIAMSRDETGNIYFGTSNGLMVFHPDSIRGNPYPSRTAITSFKVFDKEYVPNSIIAPQKKITLSHEQNFFSFEFAALNYRAPERSEYMYELIGVDKSWNYAGSRRYVSYANLKPGQYEFRVRSSNNDGIWHSRWTSVYITITPPWWATWWFRLLAGLGICLILFALYRLRVRALQQRQNQLERQVRARTAEIIHQKEEIAVQQEQLTRMNGYLKVLSDTLEDRVHIRTAELVKANEELRRKNEEIRQALVQGQTLERKRVAAELHDNLGGLLSALKLTLETLTTGQLSAPEIKVYENVLSMVTNACTEVRNISHHMLPEVLEKNGLQVALQRFVYSINAIGKIELELDVFGLDKRLKKDIEVSVYPICVELITNILKHANATRATLQLIYSRRELTIVAEDNGKGMKIREKGEGIGLRNIDSRIEAMQGVYRIDSSPESGTTITIEIPIRKRKDRSVKGS